MLELFLAILELLTGLKKNNEGLNVEFEYLWHRLQTVPFTILRRN